MTVIRFPIWILLAAFVLTAGCATTTPDPLAGWHFYSRTKVSQVITDDYQDYIQKLPPKKRNYVGDISFFEDGTGQHAVSIEINLNGTEWKHVLIYDKEDKRIKAMKYVSGHYRS